MNSLILNDAAWRLLGWTMLHFLWVGGVVAVVGGILRLACRRASPAVRYSASLSVLAALVAAAVGVGAWVANSAPSAPLIARVAVDAERVDALPADAPTVIDLKETHLVAAPTSEVSGVGNDAHRPTKSDATPPPPMSGVGNDAQRPTDSTNTKVGAEPPAAEGVLANAAKRADSVSVPPNVAQRIVQQLDRLVPLLPWLWLAGAAGSFAWIAAGLTGSHRLRRACRPIVDGPIAAAAREVQLAIGVTRTVAIAFSEQVAQPVLVGIVRPLVLLPAATASGWEMEQIELALAHELAHVRRWDNAVNLLQRVVEAVLWFHPAVWLASRQIRRDREACCDAAVVRLTGRPEAYANLLVQLAASLGQGQPATLAAASALGSHPLMERVRRILNVEDEPMQVSRSTMGVVAAVVVVALALALPLPGAADTAVAKQDGDAGDRAIASEDAAARYENAPPTAAATDEASQPAPAATPFLTDDQQRAADLAYQLLGWELEPLTADELAFVKEHGYEGGLRIESGDRIHGADYLVGLHTKPIGSLSDIEAVLTDAKLLEKAPLKYYAIAKPRDDGGFGGFAGPEVKPGGLVRGRVAVNQMAWQHWLAATTTGRYEPNPAGRYVRDPHSLQPSRTSPGYRAENRRPVPAWPASADGQDNDSQAPRYAPPSTLQPLETVIIRVAGVSPEHSIDDAYAIDERGRVALGPVYGRVKIGGMTIDEAEEAMTKHLKRDWQNPVVQITRPQPEPAVAARPVPAPSAAWPTPPAATVPGTQVVKPTSPMLPPGANVAPYVSGDPPPGTLLYSGKTFQQWKNLGRYELNPERRGEAVVALTAFGRAGHGRKAAEAILEIAAQYDFSSSGGSAGEGPTGRLELLIVDALSGGSRIPADDVIPVLIEHYHADPSAWRGLMRAVLARDVMPSEPDVVEALLDLARDTDDPVGIDVLQTFIIAKRESEVVRQVIAERLSKSNVKQALTLLSNPWTCWSAQESLQQLPRPHREELAIAIIKRLADATNADNREDKISLAYTLAVMGVDPQIDGQTVSQRLLKLLPNADHYRVSVVTAAAYLHVAGKADDETARQAVWDRLLETVVGDQPPSESSLEKAREMFDGVMEEMSQLKPPHQGQKD